MTVVSKFQIRLRSLAEREAKIRTSVLASEDHRDFYEFRSQLIKLPLIRISQDYLVYRMENFRTYIDQHEYLIRERKVADYFLIGQENESVQQLQHQILHRLASEVPDSIAPIIDVLRKDKQREPLIITDRGVVVNGNRRLAAMRELFEEDQTEFSQLGYVDCLVLPSDTTTGEIVDIEAALQAQPETRLDYDWIADCQLIQRLLELGRKPEQISKRLNRKADEIANSISALMEANLYLREWARADGEYRRVVDAEQFFKDLPGLLEGKPPELADASRVIAWNLFDNRPDLGSRLYAFNPAIGKHASRVLSRVAKTMTVAIDGEGTSADDDPFSVDVDGADGRPDFAPVIAIFRDPSRKAEAVDTLIEVCRDVIEEERNKKGGHAALRAVNSAYARLLEVNLGAAETSTYQAIDQKLDEITERSAGLKSILTKLRDSSVH